MIELILAAMMLQPPPGPCHAVPAPRPLPDGCPNWIERGRDERGVLFGGAGPIETSADGFDILERVVFTALSNGNKSAIVRMRYNCLRRTVAPVHIYLYDERGGLRGEVPAPADRAPTAVVAGTNAGILLTRHCPR